MFTRQAEAARFDAMPNATRIERALFRLASWANRTATRMEQTRYDQAPPCSCSDPHCDRNKAHGLFEGMY